MSAPSSSFEANSLSSKTTPISADGLIIIDSEDSNLLKKTTVGNILTGSTIARRCGYRATTFTAGVFFLPIDGIFEFGASDVAMEKPMGRSGTFSKILVRTLSQIIATNDATLELLKNEVVVATLNITPSDVNTIVSDDISVSFIDSDIFELHLTIETGDSYLLAGHILLEDVPVPGGVTGTGIWGASDEDSPLSTGVIYTTQTAASNTSLSNVILSLKNAPTGSIIDVNILQEDAVNANTFTTIFSTRPTIDLNEFTSQTATIPAVISNTTWSSQRRLQIQLVTNDSNFAATGLKVELL